MTSQSTDTGRRGGVAGGIILVGIGVLALTGWWWPGIMLVIGCGLAAERFLTAGCGRVELHNAEHSAFQHAAFGGLSAFQLVSTSAP